MDGCAKALLACWLLCIAHPGPQPLRTAADEPMTYPGNPAISPEVQQRIRNTFEQTLVLAARGSRQEAALGCDFILQLDPQFRPAKALQNRLETSEGAVDVDDLRAG